MWMIKIMIKTNRIDMDVLLILEVDNIQKPRLSLKSGFFHYFIGLWILPSRTNMVQKIYRDLSALDRQGEDDHCLLLLYLNQYTLVYIINIKTDYKEYKSRLV